MSGAMVSFTSMAIAGREISQELDTFELMLFRSLLGIVIVVSVAGARGTLGQIRRKRLRLHFVRNVSHFTGQNLWFYAIALIPMAQTFALEFTVPIWVAILAPLLLGEVMTRSRAASALIGFFGILTITWPGLSTLDLSPGVIAAAASALGFAGSVLATKELSRTETVTCILFWLTVIQAGLGLMCAGYDGDIALPSWASVPWVLIVGIGGLAAHFCITNALNLAPATIVSPMDFVRLPIVAVIAMIFYGERVDLFLVVGAGLILLANFINIGAEHRSQRAADAALPSRT